MVVEATVVLLGSLKTYQGTTPPAFTSLPDLELNPYESSILSLSLKDCFQMEEPTHVF